MKVVAKVSNINKVLPKYNIMLCSMILLIVFRQVVFVRASTVSRREDYRDDVNSVLDDIEGAESVGNIRKVMTLRRTLANKADSAT